MAKVTLIVILCSVEHSDHMRAMGEGMVSLAAWAQRFLKTPLSREFHHGLPSLPRRPHLPHVHGAKPIIGETPTPSRGRLNTALAYLRTDPVGIPGTMCLASATSKWQCVFQYSSWSQEPGYNGRALKVVWLNTYQVVTKEFKPRFIDQWQACVKSRV